MNILLLGLPHLVPALRKLGHNLCCIGIHPQCDVLIKNPLTLATLLQQLNDNGFRPDVSIYVDTGNLPFILGIEHMPCPSLFYSIDTFCNPWHIPYAYAFDHILVAQKDYLSLFTAEQHPADWLPLSYTPPASSWNRRSIPVSFVGTLNPANIPTRLPFLQAFHAQLPLLMQQGDFVPVFTQSHIVLNQSAAAEVNFRCFEATACGAALLTEDVQNGLTALFSPGVSILPPYPRNKAQHAARIAAHWLARPKALQRIARAGQELCLTLHSNETRARSLLHIALKLCTQNAHQRRLATLTQRTTYLASAYAFLYAELPPELDKHRTLYLNACLQTRDASVMGQQGKFPSLKNSDS